MQPKTSQNESTALAGRADGLFSTNTSGYPGVSWHKAARKWGAYIRRDGVRRYLGLFDTAEAAHAAYQQADAETARPEPTLEERRAALVAKVRALYDEHGLKAVTNKVLNAHKLRDKLQKVGISHSDLLDILDLRDEYDRNRATKFSYRGVEKPRWTWERVIEVAADLAEQENDLPTIPWCRLNGQSHLVNVVFASGHTWEDLRAAVGLSTSQRYFDSRSGMRWRSRPEACLSNFLHARGVVHKRGEPYPKAFAEQSGRARARYDLHFQARDGSWINVEVWGDLPDHHFGERYSDTKRLKLAWHEGRADFLGISHLDCHSDEKLAAILAPYLDSLAITNLKTEADKEIETSHWSDADELLATCRAIAAGQPDGKFPTEEWLRKRGKFSDRDGPAYNTVAVYAQRWLGGTRKVRELLGQAHASTMKWDRERVVCEWVDFEQRHGVSPFTAQSPKGRIGRPAEVVAEAGRIYAAARYLDVRDEERGILSGRKVYWTPERALSEWTAFVAQHGCKPTECMSASKRRELPRELTAEATRIYGAVQRLGLLGRVMSSAS